MSGAYKAKTDSILVIGIVVGILVLGFAVKLIQFIFF
jgi:hypothetical protein